MKTFTKIFVAGFCLLLFMTKSNAGLIEHNLDVAFDGTDLTIDYSGDYSLEQNSSILMTFEAKNDGFWNGIDGWLFVGLPVEGERDKRRGIFTWSFLLDGVQVNHDSVNSTAQYGHIGDTLRGYNGAFDQLIVEYEFLRSDLGETQVMLSPNFQSFWSGSDGLPFSAEFSQGATEVSEPLHVFILAAILGLLFFSYRQQNLS